MSDAPATVIVPFVGISVHIGGCWFADVSVSLSVCLCTLVDALHGRIAECYASDDLAYVSTCKMVLRCTFQSLPSASLYYTCGFL